MTEYIMQVDEDGIVYDEFREPVVRCRDCKHCVDEPWMGRSVFICNRTPWQRSEGERKAGEFCSRGERREE